mmetsp:Transcript_21190/g.29688  ORF Transcript_21190/g.29688 Transcript_21190/m.29688 type:complete len:262 (-) Transcript_21190:43-828(-)
MQDDINRRKSTSPIEKKAISTPTKSTTSTTSTTIQDKEFLFPNVTPFHLLFFSSLPLCLGAYAGYKFEITNAASSTAETYAPGSLSSTSGSRGGGLFRKILSTPAEVPFPKPSSTQPPILTPSSVGANVHIASQTIMKDANVVVKGQAPNINIGAFAFKALGLGTLLSLGGMGLLTASIFRLTGSDSLEDLIQTVREWTPRKRKELEDAIGLRPKSLQHKDVKATKGMTEDQEWTYIKRKYIPELLDKHEEEENLKEEQQT